MKDQIVIFFSKYISTLSLQGVSVRWEDIVEILIISFLVYQIMTWIKNTKAWFLMKGIGIILIFILLAIIFEMNTILWIVENVLSIAVIAVVVVLQPELRRALEELGRKKFFASLMPFDKVQTERFSDKTVNDLVKASFEMGKVKTGALMVIEQNVKLTEYERTGIEVDFDQIYRSKRVADSESGSLFCSPVFIILFNSEERIIYTTIICIWLLRFFFYDTIHRGITALFNIAGVLPFYQKKIWLHIWLYYGNCRYC